MDTSQFIGLVVSSIITLGAFIGVIMKFTQPINDLRVVIQKLNDNIDAMKEENDKQDARIAQHGKELDSLGRRVDKLETKVKCYHEDKEKGGQ